MALTPGMKCSCGCGCAKPAVLNPKGCPCACGACLACGSRGRSSAETAPARAAGHALISETRRSTVPATPPATPISDTQFQALLSSIHGAAPAVAPQQPSVQESAPLHTLSNDELGRRLVRQLAEHHKSPYWAQVTENADTRVASAPSGLAEQVQSLPGGLPSMSLTEALATAHDLHSPAWSRTPGARGVRTIFDA